MFPAAINAHGADVFTETLAPAGHVVLASADSDSYRSLRRQPMPRAERFKLGRSLRQQVPRSSMRDWSEPRRRAVRAKQGTPVPGVEMRIADEAGRELQWDGKTVGELQVRGPWIARTYYNDDRSSESFSPDGWLKTGDMAVVTPDAYIRLVDRTKDVIKSGGEWISSVDLENAIMGHPKVAEAAVIAVPHPKWAERPLACVVVKEGEELSKEEVLEYLNDKVAKWWLPDDVVFIDEVPKTSVGKFSKKDLRGKFEGYQLPTA